MATIANGDFGSGPGDPTGVPDGGGVMPVPANTMQVAMAKYPDLRTLWGTSVTNTCGPNSGVCHDSRQFPDLQTAAGLIGAVGQRCNQIRTDPTSIDNMCEPPGDVLSFGAFTTHIGNVTATPDGAPTTVTITLSDKIPAGTTTASVAVVRQLPGLSAVKIPVPAAAINMLTVASSTITLSYTALAAAPGIGKGNKLSAFFVPNAFAPGDDSQVELGDPNGDGIFGATLGAALIKPGDPLNSFLFQRVLGPMPIGPGHPLTNVAAMPATETQMPIANQQYWDIDPDLVALWCWISTMKPDASNADGPIDYANCDISKMPDVTHQGNEATTYSSVYATTLQPACAGPCHYKGTKEGTTLFLDDPQVAYDTLLGIGGVHPSESSTIPYVTPDDHTKSFLYLKVAGDPTAGTRMPLGGMLPQSQIDAIKTWIDQGANHN
jgi:hypothetical protein